MGGFFIKGRVGNKPWFVLVCLANLIQGHKTHEGMEIEMAYDTHWHYPAQSNYNFKAKLYPTLVSVEIFSEAAQSTSTRGLG